MSRIGRAQSRACRRGLGAPGLLVARSPGLQAGQRAAPAIGRGGERERESERGRGNLGRRGGTREIDAEWSLQLCPSLIPASSPLPLLLLRTRATRTPVAATFLPASSHPVQREAWPVVPQLATSPRPFAQVGSRRRHGHPRAAAVSRAHAALFFGYTPGFQHSPPRRHLAAAPRRQRTGARRRRAAGVRESAAPRNIIVWRQAHRASAHQTRPLLNSILEAWYVAELCSFSHSRLLWGPIS